MTFIYRALVGSTTPNAISKGVFKSRVTPDSYHSTLSLCDNLTVCFHLEQHNSFAYISSLLHAHRNFGYLHGSLTPTQKFWISPRVSYTHTEIRDGSPGLLHPHINLGFLHGSLTPTQKFGTSPRVSYTHTQKFGISPRVSYTHTEIWDISPSLLHPHRTSQILPRVSFTLTPSFSP